MRDPLRPGGRRKIAPRSVFARKNYFYPDLPKGYQISQYELPVVVGGQLAITVGEHERVVKLTRAHLEEDAGKSLHECPWGELPRPTGIDLNRAGTPLLEIVTEPDMRSSAEAVAYARALHALVRWIGICDGNMQEGSFRCDANVSVRPVGQADFGTRREIKNLNSFRFMQQAIDYEVQWQIATLEDGGRIEQATVLFDPRERRNTRHALQGRRPRLPLLPRPRSAAAAHRSPVDRRDRSQLPELPAAQRDRLAADYGLSAYDAKLLTSFARTRRVLRNSRCRGRQRGAKACANWVMVDLTARLNKEELDISQSPVSPEQLGGMVARIVDGTISTNIARKVFDALCNGEGSSADEIIASQGLQQITDSGCAGNAD
jgi:aspartyl-tRNA(Asn)/glutamyl-tRNA(Gln) amidotransferase subunit B